MATLTKALLYRGRGAQAQHQAVTERAVENYKLVLERIDAACLHAAEEQAALQMAREAVEAGQYDRIQPQAFERLRHCSPTP